MIAHTHTNACTHTQVELYQRGAEASEEKKAREKVNLHWGGRRRE